MFGNDLPNYSFFKFHVANTYINGTLHMYAKENYCRGIGNQLCVTRGVRMSLQSLFDVLCGHKCYY